MGRLFGTDGARGVANTELTCELSMQIGRAAAMVLAKNLNGKKPKVMIGLDTRAWGSETATLPSRCVPPLGMTILRGETCRTVTNATVDYVEQFASYLIAYKPNRRDTPREDLFV